MKEKPYGYELILDLFDCDPLLFNRKDIKKFFKDLCKVIDMDREKCIFWDYEGYPEEKARAPSHLKGTSAIQFIKTSNITIHTFDDTHKVLLNIFSCKRFDESVAIDFCTVYFRGYKKAKHFIERF